MIWLESHKTKNKVSDFWFLAHHFLKKDFPQNTLYYFSVFENKSRFWNNAYKVQ